MGAIAEATNAAIVLVAITTVVVAPLAFNRLVGPAVLPQTMTVIIGGSAQARTLAQRLQAQDERVTLITAVPEFLAPAGELELDVRLVSEDQYVEAVQAMDSDVSPTVVCMLEDAQSCRDVSLSVKNDLKIETVITHVTDPNIAEALRREGIDVVEPSTASMVVLEMRVRHAGMFSLLTDMDMERKMRSAQLRNSRLFNRHLRDVRLPGNALIIAIRRRADTVIPHGDTLLIHGDRLTVVGTRVDVQAAVEYLESRA
jgi:Trk K+ transport system NAD-binding subunit